MFCLHARMVVQMDTSNWNLYESCWSLKGEVENEKSSMNNIFLTFSSEFIIHTRSLSLSLSFSLCRRSVCLAVLCQRYYLSCKVTFRCRHNVQNSTKSITLYYTVPVSTMHPMFFSKKKKYVLYPCLYDFISERACVCVCLCVRPIWLTYSLNAWCFRKSRPTKTITTETKKCIFGVFFSFSLFLTLFFSLVNKNEEL